MGRRSTTCPDPGPGPAGFPAPLPALGSAAARALPWPARVPLLVAADLGDPRPLARGERPQIWHWLDLTFPGHKDPDHGRAVVHALAHRELFLVQTEELGLPQALALRIFALSYPAEQTAALWNRAMARLGYAVPTEKQHHGTPHRRRRPR